jgi:hypothetical protein
LSCHAQPRGDQGSDFDQNLSAFSLRYTTEIIRLRRGASWQNIAPPSGAKPVAPDSNRSEAMPIDHADSGQAASSPRAGQPSPFTDARAEEQKWSRRRWATVFVLSVCGLLGLLAHEISARTAIMLAGSLLCFALSADRLNHYET